MVWYDISEIKDWQGHYTGIQRVIAELGSRLFVSDIEMKCCYLDRATNTYRNIDYVFQQHQYTLDVQKEVGVAETHRLKSLLEKSAKKLPVSVKNRIKKYAYSRAPQADDIIAFAPGDTLFIPGAFWIYPYTALANLKRDHKLKIVGVMYDLVPLAVPQYTAEVTTGGYEANFVPALEVVDNWLAISENTKQDLLHFSKHAGVGLDEDKVVTFRLGDDIPNNHEASPPDSRLVPQEYLMCVSTLEARKNQILLYQSMKLALGRNLKILPIVLVGKRGWLSDDLIYVITHDDAVKDKIIWLDRVDDSGLNWLYANAAFTVYPSFYEGWGLPVSESLRHGVPCIASSESSIPEVGGEFVEYFSPFSTDELLNHLVKYSDPHYVARRKKLLAKFPQHTWGDSAEFVKNYLHSI